MDIPESCIAQVFSFISPKDICRLALVNSAFRAASDSDTVWEAKLPRGYYSHIAGCVDGGSLQYTSKKELYFRLCRSIYLKNGIEKYWLDCPTGQECHILSARGLGITWGDDPRYWWWITHPDGSWFQEVAYLNQVCWFEVQGKFQHLFQPGAYTLSFRIQIAEGYGWDQAPVKFTLDTSNGCNKESRHFLRNNLSVPPANNIFSNLPQGRFVAGWMECDAGEFVVDDSEVPIDLHFSMAAYEVGNWKHGLLLDGVIIRSSNLLEQY
eukprot:c14460_g1_i1 orf=305-1105(-)